MKAKDRPDYLHNVFSEDSKYYFNSQRHINVNCPTHVNYSMEIVIVTKGVLNMIVGSIEYEVKEGEAVFIQPFELHSFISKQDNECNVIVFSPDLVSDFFEFIKKHSHTNCLFKVSEDVFALMERLLPEEMADADGIRSQAVLFPLCCDVKDKLEFTQGQRKFEDALLNALNYINIHFTEKITLESVANQVGIHHVTLSRKLSRRAQTNFNAYLNYQRCTFAAGLMLNEKISCTDAAFASGFGSIRSFNRAFINFFGATPTEYKKEPDKYKNLYYH